MKILTLNFLTCAISACKSSTKSFPLHPKDAELEGVELEFSPEFLRNLLSRIEWDAMQAVCAELGLTLPAAFSELSSVSSSARTAKGDQEESFNRMEGVEAGELAASAPHPAISESAAGADAGASNSGDRSKITDEDLKALHEIIIETQMVSGKLVCGNCGHEYAVKEGIANFLLPPHLVG